MCHTPTTFWCKPANAPKQQRFGCTTKTAFNRSIISTRLMADRNQMKKVVCHSTPTV